MRYFLAILVLFVISFGFQSKGQLPLKNESQLVSTVTPGFCGEVRQDADETAEAIEMGEEQESGVDEILIQSNVANAKNQRENADLIACSLSVERCPRKVWRSRLLNLPPPVS